MTDTYLKMVLGAAATAKDGENATYAVHSAFGTYIQNPSDIKQAAIDRAMDMRVEDTNNNGILDGGDTLLLGVTPENPILAGLGNAAQSVAFSAMIGGADGGLSAIYSGVTGAMATSDHMSGIDTPEEVIKLLGANQIFMSQVVYDPDPNEGPAKDATLNTYTLYMENGNRQVTMTNSISGERMMIEFDAQSNIVALQNPETGFRLEPSNRDEFNHGLSFDKLQENKRDEGQSR